MKRKILYSSPYIPPEWIKAHGFQAVNVIEQKQASYLETGEGICPYAQLMLNTAVEFAGPAIFTTRCDQMRRIAELFHASRTRLFLMNIPATWQHQTAVSIFKDELVRLSRFLVRSGGQEPDLKTLVSLCLNRSAPVKHIEMTGRKIALMGGPSGDLDSELIEIIRDNSASVSLNATETGELAIPQINSANLQKDPVAELANAYFAEMPDIAKRPNTQFYEKAAAGIKEKEIDAIIIRTYPWCDIWHAEIPRIKEYFKLPVLHFTADVCTSPKNDSRLKTRLKAFFEML